MADNMVSSYIRESFEELSKVTWPTKNQAVKLTIIVLVFCVITALVLGVLDLGLNRLFDYLLKIAA